MVAGVARLRRRGACGRRSRPPSTRYSIDPEQELERYRAKLATCRRASPGDRAKSVHAPFATRPHRVRATVITMADAAARRKSSLPKRPESLRPLRGGGAQHPARPPTCSTRCSPPTRTARDLARDILVCEQEGDRITHDIIQRLNQTFVTPIDREDILALASALDDVVDYTEEVADYLGPLQDRGADGAGAAAGPHPRCRPPGRSPRRCRGCATFKATLPVHRSRSTGSRTTATGSPARPWPSLFDDGIDPMVVIRWKDIYERLEAAIDADRARRQHPRGHRDQEPLTPTVEHRTSSSSSSSSRRWPSTSPTASTTPPTSSPRRSRPARCRPRTAVAYASVLNFVGAFISLAVAATIAKGHRRPGRDRRDGRLRGADRRDRLEPAHLVLRAALVVLARAHRRRGRRDLRRRRHEGDQRRPAWSTKLIVPALVAPVLAFAVAAMAIAGRLPDRRAAAAGAGQPRVPPRAGASRAVSWRSPTAPTTPRRPWASSRSP